MGCLGATMLGAGFGSQPIARQRSVQVETRGIASGCFGP